LKLDYETLDHLDSFELIIKYLTLIHKVIDPSFLADGCRVIEIMREEAFGYLMREVALASV